MQGTEVKDSKTEDGWYHYGKTSSTAYQSYSVGDVVTYNGMDFYVIEASDEKKDSVTLLKAEPLTVDEVNTYGVGHINRYAYDSAGTVSNQNGYGGIVYYTSTTCGKVNGSLFKTGCTTDYNASEVKYVVDAWATDKFSNGDLVEDATGYSARLITTEDLINNLGCEKQDVPTYMWLNPENTPSWVYNENYQYWTMSESEDFDNTILYVNNSSSAGGGGVSSGSTHYGNVHFSDKVVRPVVTILKSAI